MLKFKKFFSLSRVVIKNYYKYCTTSEITAGVLIIGDEILNGHTSDVNSDFFIKHLNEVGLKINKISVLPDDIDIIAEEVASLSKKCTVVLTSGGIGPTHDDVTFEAVAKAFGERLTVHKELVSLFEKYFGAEAIDNPAVLKFSSIPQSAVLNFGLDQSNSKKFPLISTKNIYMFPGVPNLLQKGFDVFKSIFLLHNKPNHVKTIHLITDEFELTPLLNKAVKNFESRVKFGSYPSFNKNYFKVKLVLESKNEEFLKEAENFFCENLPPESKVTLKSPFLSPYQDVHCLAMGHKAYQEALSVIKEALERYPLSEITFCFSGGKDCTALLHLVYSYVQNKSPEQWHQMNVLFINSGDTFSEVDDFIKLCELNYQFKLVTLSGHLKESLKTYLQKHPHVKAVFMGSRLSDHSSGKPSYFHPSDQDWPPVMRVCPILKWTHGDVWKFIRTLQLPYCTLYDRGYTSLGTKSGTKKNPALLIEDKRNVRIYKPAYLLESGCNERHGRT